MKNSLVLLQAFAAGSALAQEYIRCYEPITGNPPPELATDLVEDDLEARQGQADRSYEVPTYVHVITSEAKEGMYPRSMVEEQMRVMNEEYQSSGFSFNTLDIDYSVNDTWAATVDGPVEFEYKQALRRGGYDTLNLYFLSDLGGGLLGFCYFPEKKPSDDLREVLDGCVNLAGSMPGGEVQNYNKGYTAVHEAGHWLSLFHVFQGASCTGPGDYVPDTPIQETPTSGCPTSKDSCPGKKGLDSIANFMDYSFDTCLDQFSDFQGKRARKAYRKLRLNNKK